MTRGGAVDPPRARVERQLGRRLHRRITGPSGLLLFICMFLPAVKGCSAPVYPLEVPAALPPYVLGLLFALAASAFTVRSLRRCVAALRWTVILTLASSAFMTFLIPPVGIVEGVIATTLLCIVGLDRISEARAALASLATGIICIGWFGFWAIEGGALIGVYLSLVAAGGLTVGALVWLVEAASGRDAPIDLPRAVARDRV